MVPILLFRNFDDVATVDSTTVRDLLQLSFVIGSSLFCFSVG